MNLKVILLVCAMSLFAFAEDLNVVLKTEELTQMLNNMVLQNNNDEFYANTADFPTGTPDARMMGYNGTNKRGLLYTTVQDALGMTSIQAGTYTLDLQVGMSIADNANLNWLGMWDTQSSDYDRAAGGFAGAMFTELDASDRVAYTMDSANDFNLMSGISVSVTSDPSLNVLAAGAALTEDTWYDVTYTWVVSEDAAVALDGQTVYVGFAGACGAGTSLWLTNSRLTYSSVIVPRTISIHAVTTVP